MNSIFQLDRANSKGEGGPARKELSAFHYPDPADELDEDGTDGTESLSSAFSERLGIQESNQEIAEIELAFEETRLDTLATFKFATFAKQNFSPGQTPTFTREVLQKPLLPKQDVLDDRVSIAIWLAIQRFMGDLLVNPKPDKKQKAFLGPVMTIVFQSLDKYRQSLKINGSIPSTAEGSEAQKEYIQIKRKKQSSVKKIFSGGGGNRNSGSSSKSGRDLPVEKVELKRSHHYSRDADDSLLFDYRAAPETMTTNLPTQDLDLIHFIIGHAILRKQLRDEVYCQLCKLLSSNPSGTSATKGWMLLMLCAGCFQPTNKFIRYLLAFLRAAPTDYRRTAFAAVAQLKRTRANGTRFHPPCLMEYESLSKGQHMRLPVYLADGRVELVEVDSATTSAEMCGVLAERLGIRDKFGFSIYVSVIDMMSSLGCGVDHIMDALSECDQFMKVAGSSASSPWLIMYRKEMFTPWYDPGNDEMATSLIFAQICKGIKREEYLMRSETELARFIARRLFIDNGPTLVSSKLWPAIAEYMPATLAGGNQKQRDFWTQIVTASFHDLGLALGDIPPIVVRDEIVRSAPFKWPLQFSGLFEAYRLAGPHLPRNDVILGVSHLGLSLLDDMYCLLHAFQLYEIVEVSAYKTGKPLGQNITFSIVSGEEFTFLCPNTDTVCKLLNFYLDGMRRRSQYAVALQDFILQGSIDSPFSFCKGDVILLKTHPTAGQVPDWYYGQCERTALEGPFPFDAVYILPAIERPPDEFLEIFRMMSTQFAMTLPRRRGLVVLSRDHILMDSVDQ